MSLRTYHDPLHLGITLNSKDPAESMVIKLIDSAPFQRLRRIRQLGPAFLTFHGAESSRFTHSLGVFHIARRAFKRLIKLDRSLEQDKGILYGAALLHDIGHTPLSHTGEEMFGLKHESWTAYLIRQCPEIRITLEGFREGTAEEVAKIFEKNQSANRVVKALVSSQLDCDRLDYLLRDSYSTGTRYGQLDLERILTALTLAPDGDLALHPKGLSAVEHYLVVRNLMYRSVYNHRLNEVCSWLLEQLVTKARQLGPDKVWADKYMAKWLWDKEGIDLETFLANDDIRTGYHLLRWKEEAPADLSEICNRFINRNLLKAININQLSNEGQLNALAKARKLVEKKGQNPDQLCTLRHQSIDIYQPYKRGLRLWDGEHLKALEEASSIVHGLINPEIAAWLIHPKEIHEELKVQLNF